MGIDNQESKRIHESFSSCVRLFESGDLSAREVINKILIDLGSKERFDLVEGTVSLLPSSLRDELRTTVDEIIQAGVSYRGLFILGRAPEDWWKKTLQSVVRLASMLRPMLEKE